MSSIDMISGIKAKSLVSSKFSPVNDNNCDSQLVPINLINNNNSLGVVKDKSTDNSDENNNKSSSSIDIHLSSSPKATSSCKLIKSNDNFISRQPVGIKSNSKQFNHHCQGHSVNSDESEDEEEDDDDKIEETDSDDATPVVRYFDDYMSSNAFNCNKSNFLINYNDFNSDLGSCMETRPNLLTTCQSSSPPSLTNNASNNTQLSPSSPPSSSSSSSSSVTTIANSPSSVDNDRPPLFSVNTLDSDYETQRSETSTVSSSPVGEVNYPPLDEALLEEKFTKLGFSKYTIDPPVIRVNRKTGQTVPINSDDEEYDDSLPNRTPFIRSTSLKTGKTPPNTPGRGKKVVRFADSLGLDFEYVKLISQDEIPIVPRSAYQDLKLPAEKSSNSQPMHQQPKASPQRKISPSWPSAYNPNLPYTLVPEFLQPCASANFCDRVRCQKVCLENCVVTSGAGNISVTCVVRVLNISYEKQVTIRHTLTEWQTWVDSEASYLPNSCDGWSDKFSATFSIRSISAGGNLVSGQRILFAVRYIANGDEYWDNNMGLNYSLIYRS